jgi:phosphoribosylamine--glycine ligase
MLTADGPKVLEFNVRFGDPEAQVVLPRLQGDLTRLLAETAAGALTTVPRFLPEAAVCVVCASAGYPETPRTGEVIRGLTDAASVDGVTVFHAGTAAGPADGPGSDTEDGSAGNQLVTAGGRVLGVTALGATLEEARVRAYKGVSLISWPGMQVRTDIAQVAAGGSAVGSEPDPHRPPAPTAGREVLR